MTINEITTLLICAMIFCVPMYAFYLHLEHERKRERKAALAIKENDNRLEYRESNNLSA